MPLKAAIVGLGWWGRQIVRCLEGSDRIAITRAADPDIAAARDFAAAHGLSLTGRYEDVLADPAIDAVILTTPNGLHEEQTIAAAAAGKQVFCEKPLTLSAAAARRMVEACRGNGILLGIGHERRYEPALTEVKRLLDGGELGTLIHLECNWSHNRFAGASAASWRLDPNQAPAGALTATGIHIIDYFQSLAGPVARVYAQSAHRSAKFPGDDVIVVQFTFASGATGVMTNIASTPFHCRIDVFGDNGWAEACEISNLDVPDPASLTVRDAADKVTVREFPYGNTVRDNLHEWADAIAGRARYRFTDAEKIHAVQILEAVLRSLDSKGPVAVEQP